MHAGMRMQMQNPNFALDMQLSLTATAHEYVDKCAVNSLNEFAQFFQFFLSRVSQLKISHSTWPKLCFAHAGQDISKTWTQRMWSKVLCPSPSKNLRQLWHSCSLAYLSGDRIQAAVWKQVQVSKHNHAQERVRKQNRTETMQTGNSDTDRWEQLQEKMVHVCERLRKGPTWNHMGPSSTCIQKRNCAIWHMDHAWSQF